MRTLATIAKVQGTTSAHRTCTACGGRSIQGMWIHSARCPYTVILWFGHGYKASDWNSPVYRCCWFQCSGQVLPSGVTHSWDCPFWDSQTYNPGQQVPFALEGPT